MPPRFAAHLVQGACTTKPTTLHTPTPPRQHNNKRRCQPLKLTTVPQKNAHHAAQPASTPRLHTLTCRLQNWRQAGSSIYGVPTDQHTPPVVLLLLLLLLLPKVVLRATNLNHPATAAAAWSSSQLVLQRHTETHTAMQTRLARSSHKHTPGVAHVTIWLVEARP